MIYSQSAEVLRLAQLSVIPYRLRSAMWRRMSRWRGDKGLVGFSAAGVHTLPLVVARISGI